jgi:hypothetical protein
MQLRVRVYRSCKWDVSGVVVCLVLAKVQGSAPSTPLLGVDNKSVIALIKNPMLHGQSKHIEVMYHLVRESM